MSAPSALEEIFLTALAKSGGERAAYLDEACAGRTELRRQVEQMLAAQGKMGSFLEESALAGAVTEALAITANSKSVFCEAPGNSIGPYTLLQKIGEGGMGTVWLAEQREPVRRQVALKVIQAGLTGSQAVARFEAERQALALMDHPNIAKVLDAGCIEPIADFSLPSADLQSEIRKRKSAISGSRPYFVMELVQGLPVTHYCEQHRLSLMQRLELFIPVCQAIQHAHQKGIIHRDLKPSNVLVALYDGRPVPKVIDFGIAKAEQRLTEKTLLTEFGAVLGTLEYMSPEQSELNNRDIDTRSDVYSLGVLLYELLTGTTPLERQGMKEAAFTEVLRLIREEDPPRPSTRLSSSPSAKRGARSVRGAPLSALHALRFHELDWIVMKALEKDRTRRYETANSLAQDLERYLRDEPVEACPPSASYRLRKFARKHRRLLATAAAFAMLLITATVISLVLAIQAREAEAEASTNAAKVSDERDEKQRALDRALKAEKLAQQRLSDAKLAQTRAEQEADTVRAVNDFLRNDLLGQADPVRQPSGGGLRPDANVTVRTLLDRASRTLEGKFTSQPLTLAGLHLTVGDAYRSLGDFAAAQKHLAKALALRQAHLGVGHVDTLAAQNNLALAYHGQGNRKRATELLLEAVTASALQPGPNHPNTLSFKNNLAALYLEQGNYGAAEELLHAVLRAREARLGPTNPDTLLTRCALGALYRNMGKLERAELLLSEAVKAYTLNPGPAHMYTLAAKRNLASVYEAGQKHARAEALLEEVTEGLARQLPADHIHLVDARAHLGAVYQQQHKYPQAVALFRAARVRGLENPLMQAVAARLADCYESMGQPDLAEPVLRELADYRKTHDGPKTLAFSQSLAKVGRNLLLQRKPADAERLLRACLAIGEKNAPNDWSTFNARSLVGGALLDQKKYAEAEPLLLQGIEGMKQRVAQIPASAGSVLTEGVRRMVRVYEALGRSDKAAEWRKWLE